MKRLLIIDHDSTQLAIIRRTGVRLGFDVAVASTVEEAVELLKHNVFQVITLELALGDRDGVEILHVLADDKPQRCAIVIVSSCEERVLASARRVAESLNLSISGCLAKPVKLDRLREALSLPAHLHIPGGDLEQLHHITPGRLSQALSLNEISVELQPKVDLMTGRVVGAEALARWQSPELGWVSPSVFVPVAEQSGLINELTENVLIKALRAVKPIIDRQDAFTVAVNISASLLSDLALPQRLERHLDAETIQYHSLIVEITESSAMSDFDRALDILVRLRIAGIGAAIDDFGTGYSSLAVLAKLPFTELKIDQSFVKGCEADNDMLKIIHASVGLAHGFGMKVVVEGVENNAILELVRQAGCDVGQGYLFSPALRPDHAKDWVPNYTLY